MRNEDGENRRHRAEGDIARILRPGPFQVRLPALSTYDSPLPRKWDRVRDNGHGCRRTSGPIAGSTRSTTEKVKNESVCRVRENFGCDAGSNGATREDSAWRASKTKMPIRTKESSLIVEKVNPHTSIPQKTRKVHRLWELSRDTHLSDGLPR